MPNAMPREPLQNLQIPSLTTAVSPAELEAHIVKVKAAWRADEQAMTWEQKIAAIERMWERSAQLARSRERDPPSH